MVAPVVPVPLPPPPAGASCARSKVTRARCKSVKRAQLDVLRVGQVALRLHDEEVGGEADLELALFGLEPPFGEGARGARRLDAPQVACTCSAALVTSVATCSSSARRRVDCCVRCTRVRAYWPSALVPPIG